MVQVAPIVLLLGAAAASMVAAAPVDIRVARMADGQKVVNGVDAPKDKYPWVVALETRVEGQSFSCGGSLIAPGYVLTAAHCFFPTDGTTTAGTVCFGAHKSSFTGVCNGETRNIEKAIIHPLYFPLNSMNDVAVLELDAPITTITPVVLKQQPFGPKDTFGTNGANKPAVTLGWGVTDTVTEAMSAVLQQGAVIVLGLIGLCSSNDAIGWHACGWLEGSMRAIQWHIYRMVPSLTVPTNVWLDTLQATST
jgi:secreted trypsin-like serine protease